MPEGYSGTKWVPEVLRNEVGTCTFYISDVHLRLSFIKKH